MMANTRGPTCGLGAVVAVVLVGVGILGLTTQARAVAYTFTPIAEGVGLGSINNAGTVAYVGTGSDGIQRVYKTSMDGTTTVIADTAGPLGNFYFSDYQGTTPAINDQGMVAFVASTDQGRTGIYTGAGGAALQMIAEVSSSPYRGTRPYMNSSGQVLFYTETPSPTRIAVDTAGVQKTIIQTGATYDWVFTRGISDAGDVLYGGRKGNGPEKWFVGNGYTETEIPAAGLTFTGFASISNYHAVLAATDGTGESLYSYRNGSLTKLVGEGSGFKSFWESATNNKGDVVFMATPNSGRGFIFSSADLDHPIVSIGDPLLGSTIANIQMFPTLNDSGQFAFLANLSDYRQVLVRADIVPEPGVVWLTILGLSLMGRTRRVRR